jgi:hypothetical protein
MELNWLELYLLIGIFYSLGASSFAYEVKHYLPAAYDNYGILAYLTIAMIWLVLTLEFLYRLYHKGNHND